jgi:hypothetical protein
MSVDIFGIIYMYNPPDRKHFGLDDVTEDTIIDGATETIGGERVAPTPDGVLPSPDAPAVPETPADPDAQDPTPPVAAVPTAILPVAQP